MAKSKSTIYYCKWCDEILKEDCRFCSEPCRLIWTKTRNTPTEEIIQNYQGTVDALKKEILNINGTCRLNYIDNKKTLKETSDVAGLHLRTETILLAHIYNKNKDKALKTFEKLKQIHQDNIDACLFDNKTIKVGIVDLGSNIPSAILTGDESFRVHCILTKLCLQKFELMLEQTFS